MNSMGQLEGYTHQASMIYLHEEADAVQLCTLVQQLLSVETGIEFGVSAAPINGIIVRIMGMGAEQLMDCLRLISENIEQVVTIKPTEHVN
jgi:urease accessory protein